MTYTPGIPNSPDNISVSQGQIKTNFQQLETIFDNDHYTWDDATFGGAYRGYHRQVYFPLPSVGDPALGGLSSVFYSKIDPNDTLARIQLYFENASTISQMTSAFQRNTRNGYCVVANGIILMWGNSVQTASGNNNPVAFNAIGNYVGAPVGFPNNVFSVQFTIQTDTSVGAPIIVLNQAIPPTSTGFNVRVSASVPNTSINWFAIGN